MLPRADLKLTRPPTAVEAATPVLASADARQEIYHRLTQIALGKEMLANVLSRFDDGTFLVRVGDAAARMALPVGTRVGDNLPMTLIAKGPRPAFLLLQQIGFDTASVSPAGRLIDRVLQAARQDSGQAAVVAKTPLAAAASDIDPQQVAARLQKEVAGSGVFYESHLHEWISGRRALASVLQEPQAALGSSAAGDARAGTGAAALPQPNAAAPGLNDTVLQVENSAELLARLRELQALPQNKNVDADILLYRPSGGEPETGKTAQATHVPELKPEAARIVNLQLDTLENQHLRWQGELWPGLAMQWEVSKEAPQRDGLRDKDGSIGAESDQAGWTSVVRFELPTLGPVAAKIHLSGDRLQVRVSAASEESAVSLRSHGSMLADALQAAGSPLELFMVKVDEAP